MLHPTPHRFPFRALVYAIHACMIVHPAIAVQAQGTDTVLAKAGWNPMPDSLFLVWKLDDDQVRRLRVIEEDYDTERMKVMADKALTTGARDHALSGLADKRRKEVKGVLQPAQYEDWIGRTRHPSP